MNAAGNCGVTEWLPQAQGIRRFSRAVRTGASFLHRDRRRAARSGLLAPERRGPADAHLAQPSFRRGGLSLSSFLRRRRRQRCSLSRIAW
ncbi:MAG: hypothetical protein ACLR4Z_01550 [Butyricicoccaceae bacterium]